jgi:Na+/H+ antiporter NhaA
MLQSGVHATVAGILLAFFIPLRTRNAADEVPLDRLEHAINPWHVYDTAAVWLRQCGRRVVGHDDE